MTSIFLLHIGSLSLEWEGALRDSLPQSLHSQPYELPWRVPTASLTLEPSQGSTKKTICFFCQSVSTEERKGHRCQEEKTGVANAESSHGFYECELDMSTNQKSVLQCSRPWSRPGWEKKLSRRAGRSWAVDNIIIQGNQKGHNLLLLTPFKCPSKIIFLVTK